MISPKWMDKPRMVAERFEVCQQAVKPAETGLSPACLFGGSKAVAGPREVNPARVLLQLILV